MHSPNRCRPENPPSPTRVSRRSARPSLSAELVSSNQDLIRDTLKKRKKKKQKRSAVTRLRPSMEQKNQFKPLIDSLSLQITARGR